MKVLKNVEIAMILLDVVNNRPILDGSTVFLGDQVLIDIKASIKGAILFITLYLPQTIY